MHYHVEIWLRHKPRNHVHAEAVLQEILAPFENDYWDWWEVGGRWTGAHDDYDPTKDPVNLETCSQCNGTGDRPNWVTYVNGVRTFVADDGLKASADWSKQCNGCNGCLGAGRSVKHSYAPHRGDIMAIRKIPKDLESYAIVIDDEFGYVWHDLGKKKVLPFLKSHLKAGARGCLVTVDCHN